MAGKRISSACQFLARGFILAMENNQALSSVVTNPDYIGSAEKLNQKNDRSNIPVCWTFNLTQFREATNIAPLCGFI